LQGNTFSREGHPNADVLAGHLDRLEAAEGAGHGMGMAVVSTVLIGLMESGNHVFGGHQLYGWFLQLMRQDLTCLDVTTGFADSSSAATI